MRPRSARRCGVSYRRDSGCLSRSAATESGVQGGELAAAVEEAGRCAAGERPGFAPAGAAAEEAVAAAWSQHYQNQGHDLESKRRNAGEVRPLQRL